MRSIASIIVLAAVASLAAARGPVDDAPVWITLEKDAEVQGLVVRLSDIAEISSLDARLGARIERIEVGNFAEGRDRLVLLRESVRAILAERGFGGEGVVIRGADRVVVRPMTVTIAPDRLRRLAEAHIREVLRGQKIDDIKSAAPLRPVTIPGGRFQFDLEVQGDERNPLYAGRVEIVVVAKVDGKIAERIPVPMTVERRGTIVVAKRRIPQGRLIEYDDVETREVPLGAYGAGLSSSVERVVGQTARGTLLKDQPIRDTFLRAQPVIRRGDVVTARVVLGRLEVKALCRALKEGAPGDRIELENVETGTRVLALVVDSRTVDALLQN
ncbi:MAG: flagellar basal body P-ring formation chaperone FlgA [Planctomycetota bacterium]